MHSTTPSLLIRLRQPNADEAWRRFVDLYTPFLIHLLVNRMHVRRKTPPISCKRFSSRCCERSQNSSTTRRRAISGVTYGRFARRA